MDQRESSEGNPVSPDIVQLIKHRVCISPAAECIFLPLCSPPTVRNVDAFSVHPSSSFRPEKWLLFPLRLWRTAAKKKWGRDVSGAAVSYEDKDSLPLLSEKIGASHSLFNLRAL